MIDHHAPLELGQRLLQIAVLVVRVVPAVGAVGALERLERGREAGEHLVELRQAHLPNPVQTAEDASEDHGVEFGSRNLQVQAAGPASSLALSVHGRQWAVGNGMDGCLRLLVEGCHVLAEIFEVVVAVGAGSVSVTLSFAAAAVIRPQPDEVHARKDACQSRRTWQGSEHVSLLRVSPQRFEGEEVGRRGSLLLDYGCGLGYGDAQMLLQVGHVVQCFLVLQHQDPRRDQLRCSCLAGFPW
ncbi:hypothetical protein N657DRAFT_445486 [Parathielavia appendiculata]|uniref:Uncharacterized protein n=1 Tax=Parathielavia appendiculata TaxID=2587402 RepID=A0AAN6Z3T2_9PEZI|nr:hypothetical protein N657DRAFT_445486 [Parathielavia appendiculata]